MKNYSYHFTIKEYYDYLNFIENCRNKVYENEVTHVHHIIPKHICEKLKNDKNNIIELSVEDHAKSHLLFSKMWPINSYEQRANLWSYSILTREKDFNLLNDIKESRKGENNTFYGKQHTLETRKILSEKTTKFLSGMTYEERYGDTSVIEKEKRSEGVKNVWKNRDDGTKENIRKKISEKLKGKMCGEDNPYSKKCQYKGKTYGSLIEACKDNNTYPSKIKKSEEFKFV